MGNVKWFKINLPFAIGNSIVDNVAIAKQKLLSIRNDDEIQTGIVYDPQYEFQLDLIKCNPYIDHVRTNREHGDRELFDPTEELSWNYLVYNNEKVRFSVPEDVKERGKKILLKNEIDVEKDRVISFQAREPGYKYYPTKDRHPFRFVDIGTFLRFARHYINKGFKIIRIGGNECSYIPNMSGFFDASHLENKSLIDDMYFTSVSDYFVGCDSAGWQISVAFGVPTLVTNHCHGLPGIGMERHIFPWEEGHEVICKQPFINGMEVSPERMAIVTNGLGWNPEIFPFINRLDNNTFEEMVEAFERLVEKNR